MGMGDVEMSVKTLFRDTEILRNGTYSCWSDYKEINAVEVDIGMMNWLIEQTKKLRKWEEATRRIVGEETYREIKNVVESE